MRDSCLGIELLTKDQREGLRLAELVPREGGHCVRHTTCVKCDLDDHARQHYADTIRDLAKVKAELVAVQQQLRDAQADLKQRCHKRKATTTVKEIAGRCEVYTRQVCAPCATRIRKENHAYYN